VLELAVEVDALEDELTVVEDWGVLLVELVLARPEAREPYRNTAPTSKTAKIATPAAVLPEMPGRPSRYFAPMDKPGSLAESLGRNPS
jgi:hypothetical protein